MGGFDVVKSCERQASFLWQVSGPNFYDENFLHQGVYNYIKFVKLMGNKSKPQFLVPTYQIDLIWHTHILASIAKYHEDNMKFGGRPLEHDDSLNDRSENGVLNSNFNATRKLWRKVYNEEYVVSGGMYRGEPPAEYFKEDWSYTNMEYTLHQSEFLVHNFIGQVGASSHAKYAWMSIDAADAFIPANPKSTTKGVNANRKKEGYIFGKGNKGLGYYSLNTRESYDVLIKRL